MRNKNQNIEKHNVPFRLFLGWILVFFIIGTFSSFAQEDKKSIKKAEQAHAEARKAEEKGDFYQAEANYRKSISNNPTEMDSRYNLGNSYYDKEQYKESLVRYKEAVQLAESKANKHAAYHNLGNAFMKNQQYRKAEEAFKEALRNMPTDEETRYNYAIAKELAKDEPEQSDENPEASEDEENEDDNQGQDQNPEQDQGEDENDQGDKQEQEGEPENEEEEGQKDQQEVPKEGKLSPEQIENLLNAMENAEKDVQKKLEEEKEKGRNVKKEKYW